MALANAAALLAQRGKNVLVVDWDLEAPGIERFFSGPSLRLSPSRQDTPGIVDLILAHAEKRALSWKDCMVNVSFDRSSQPVSSVGSLKLITAGMLREESSRDYVHRLRELNWESLFKLGFGNLIEQWRSSWIKEFHFVLIDSRTGISDIGNICTILLPDVLVLVFTTSDQSVDGIADVMRRARAAQSQLPLSRGRLSAVPLLSRDEREKESKLAEEWRNKIAERLGEFYKDWLPAHTTVKDVLQKLYIPSVAVWSFGERLPVIEKSEEIGDSRSIVASYARLARLLEHQLDWTKIEGEEEALRRAERERRLAEEGRLKAERALEEIRRTSGLTKDPVVFSYLGLRRIVGSLATALPFVLAFGNALLEGPGILSSMSAYYYTPMRTVFLGILITVGALLMISVGYDSKDRILGRLAGIFAIGAAIFPTAPVMPAMASTSPENLFGQLHSAFMVLLLLTIAYMCLVQFTQTTPDKTPTRRKLQRNTVYRVCGYTILASLLLIGVSLSLIGVVKETGLFIRQFYPVFWLESLAFLAFGVSWLTKGEAILKDEEFPSEIPHA